jgi:membrane fusion protein (multidrug efflux system)
MSCVVRVHNLEQTPQILIPGKAIIEQMGEYFVYLAKDTVLHNADSTGKGGQSAEGQAAAQSADQNGEKKGGEKDTARGGDAQQHGPRLRSYQVRVQTGQTIGADVIIQSGLKEGDRVIVDGIQSLHDGSPITTANKQGPAAAGGRGR